MMESYDSITFAAALAKLGMSKDASSGLRFVSRRFEENGRGSGPDLERTPRKTKKIG